MLRGLLRLISFLVGMALAGFALTTVWIVYDGIHDDYDHADVALVPGYMEIKDGVLAPALVARLDRAVTLYKAGSCSFIIVSGVTPLNENDETEAMAQYLEAAKVPADAIIQDHRGVKANDTVDNFTRIMKDQRFHSVLLVTDYYRIARLKLVLRHAGVREIEQVHVGEWKKEDNLDILREQIVIYKDLYNWYLLPATAKVSEETDVEAKALKEKVNNGLDSLHK